jgi:hypothetical protein
MTLMMSRILTTISKTSKLPWLATTTARDSSKASAAGSQSVAAFLSFWGPASVPSSLGGDHLILRNQPGEFVMAKPEVEKPLVEADRRAIFLALVEAQDVGDNVLQSRKAIAGRFKISQQLVCQIETEGLDAGWPPLE